jgi:ABC-2 type transport system ATP-binding protein
MLEVDHISKSFGKVAAVSDLSFVVKPGTIFGLLGPNGAGKTTTIRIILDILEPDTGEVRWNGKRVGGDVRRTFGYLPEERGLYPKMKVFDQLLFLARLHGVPDASAKKRIGELAAALNLTEKLQSVPTELSKGNQQKAQFIAAVVHEPPLLVLDEPFAGFDPINVQVVRGAIRDLVARGTTVMLSSHRMDQVEELCEDICIIDRSRAVLAGNLREIKRGYPERTITVSTSLNDIYIAAVKPEEASA